MKYLKTSVLMAAVLVVGIFAFTSAIPTQIDISTVNNDSFLTGDSITPEASALNGSGPSTPCDDDDDDDDDDKDDDDDDDKDD